MLRVNLRSIKLAVTIIAVLCFSGAVYGQAIHTASEANGFSRYTSYAEMVDYLAAIQKTSKEMLLGTYGKSIEGRDLYYAVFSRPLIAKPWEAIASGKPIVVLSANVHGGERTLRESNMLLIRELADSGSEINRLLDDVVIIMVPSINVDGFEATPGGTRGNSQGVDMNRDYMKLEQPSLRKFVKNIIHTWHPHLYIDGHNGGSRPYHICYQAPSHASPDQRITLLADQKIFPFIEEKMQENGYKTWYYTGGNEERWRTGGFDPRIGRNYGGFINTVGILFESPWSLGRGENTSPENLELGVRSGLVAYKAVLQYAQANAQELMMVVERARRETIEMGEQATGDIPVEMEYAPEDYKVDYEIIRDNEVIQVTGAELIKKPVILKTRPRPYAYILEAKAYKSIEMLKRHNIMIEVLSEDTELDVEAYNMTGIERGPEYDHPAAVTVTVADETIKIRRTFKAGSYVIRTGQVMGRVVTHMLEPETNDNVIRWNTMDAILPSMGRGRGGGAAFAGRGGRGGGRGAGRGGAAAGSGRGGRGGQQGPQERIIPIFKLMSPTNLSTKILNY